MTKAHIQYVLFYGRVLVVPQNNLFSMFIASKLSGMCLNIMEILLSTVTKPTTLASVKIILNLVKI